MPNHTKCRSGPVLPDFAPRKPFVWSSETDRRAGLFFGSFRLPRDDDLPDGLGLGLRLRFSHEVDAGLWVEHAAAHCVESNSTEGQAAGCCLEVSFDKAEFSWWIPNDLSPLR